MPAPIPMPSPVLLAALCGYWLAQAEEARRSEHRQVALTLCSAVSRGLSILRRTGDPAPALEKVLTEEVGRIDASRPTLIVEASDLVFVNLLIQGFSRG